MIELTINGAMVSIRGQSRELDQRINEACRFQPEGVKFSQKYLDGEWDGYYNLWRYGKADIGLLNIIKRILYIEEERFKLTDYRQTEKPTPVSIIPKYALRDYQQPVFDNIVKRGGGIIRLPTGAGKTIVALHILARYGLPGLLLSPTKDLVDQTMTRAEEAAGVDMTHMTSEWIKDPDRDWSAPFWAVATWQTILSIVKQIDAKKLTTEEVRDIKKLFARFDILLGDEAHSFGSDKTHLICKKFPARYRIGMSATPMRLAGDTLRMTASFGEVTQGLTPSELIRSRWLVIPRIQYRQIPPVKISEPRKWQTVYREYIVDNDERNDMLAEDTIKYAKMGRHTLVMLKEIRHGKIMKNRILEHGFLDKDQVEFVHGQLSNKKRKKLTDDFRSGELPVAISSSIWNQAVDFRQIDAMVMAGPYKSQIVNQQRKGRGLRIFCKVCGGHEPCDHPERKKDVVITETSDSVWPMRDWSLDRMEMDREEKEFVLL